MLILIGCANPSSRHNDPSASYRDAGTSALASGRGTPDVDTDRQATSDGGAVGADPNATGPGTDSSGNGDGAATIDGNADAASEEPSMVSSDDGENTESPLPDHCPEPSIEHAPRDLACTGLYTDVASKQLAGRVRSFKPALELWSDGADKARWIYLPKDTRIDTSDPDSWEFPVGTKLFKQFSWKGRRVETRMFSKASVSLWLKAAYAWSEDETQAERFAGGEVSVAGEPYYIPSAKECDQCHKGRVDRALGFEAISMGLPGAAGLTTAKLTEEGLVSDDMSQAVVAIGDDGTGHAADALGWLHVNCGVSCHSRSSAAEGFSTDMWLRLDVANTGGGPTGGVDAISTTVGIRAATPRWEQRTRIVAGSAENSLLFDLMSTRNPAEPKDQMPPIASRVAHDAGIALLRDWINAMEVQ